MAQNLITFSVLFFSHLFLLISLRDFVCFGHDFLAAEFKTCPVASKLQFETERYTGKDRHKNTLQLRYNHSDESLVTIVTFLPLFAQEKKLTCYNVMKVYLTMIYS